MKRFFDKIDKTESCWNWTAGGRNGYGSIKHNGKTIDTHRMSWMIHFGEIPDGLFVCHKCDNRKCVNPNHLFLGTNQDNMKDAFNKGRLNMPTSSWFKENNIPTNRTLKTIDEIIFIKKSIKEKTCSLKELSITLNIPYQLLRDINCGRVYKD